MIKGKVDQEKRELIEQLREIRTITVTTQELAKIDNELFDILVNDDKDLKFGQQLKLTFNYYIINYDVILEDEYIDYLGKDHYQDWSKSNIKNWLNYIN